ncbi:hypothetical protein [Leclercia pneumoniae]|uniref:hypothetical protein n=1 Tax=Leclercia pneumoniae TaxID=2815358 RepID=UPI003AF6725E
MRGYVPRGWAHGSSVDSEPNRVIGSIQEDAIRNITGRMGFESIRTDHGYVQEGALYTQQLSTRGPDHDKKIRLALCCLMPHASFLQHLKTV